MTNAGISVLNSIMFIKTGVFDSLIWNFYIYMTNAIHDNALSVLISRVESFALAARSKHADFSPSLLSLHLLPKTAGIQPFLRFCQNESKSISQRQSILIPPSKWKVSPLIIELPLLDTTHLFNVGHSQQSIASSSSATTPDVSTISRP